MSWASSFYSWYNWSCESLNDILTAMQLVNGGVGMWIYSDTRSRELNYVYRGFSERLTESSYYFYVVFYNTMKNLTTNDIEFGNVLVYFWEHSLNELLTWKPCCSTLIVLDFFFIYSFSEYILDAYWSNIVLSDWESERSVCAQWVYILDGETNDKV